MNPNANANNIPLRHIVVNMNAPPAVQRAPAAATAAIANTDYDVFSRDGSSCARRLDNCLCSTFSSEASQFCVETWTSDDNTNNRQRCTNPATLQQRLPAIQNAPVCIISISQSFSNAPLSVSKPAMQELVRTLDVTPDFAAVILAFGEVPRTSESGLDCCSLKKEKDGSFELSYLYRFVERDSPSSDFQFRQIGVYHHHNAGAKRDLFIFLQPHSNSRFDGRVEMMLRVPSAAQTFLAAPLRLHEVLLSTHVDSWRHYLAKIAESFNEESDMVFTEDLQKDSYAKNFEYLQQWRDLADRAEQLPAHFRATTRILKTLQRFQEPSMVHFLESQVDLFASVGDSSAVLQSRIRGVIGLLSNTIDTKNQEDSANLNQYLLRMTRFSVDDSASVKLITILTLVYLPASFVATLFGMNLFVFNPTTRKIVIATDFWLWVVIFAPLTLLTFAAWKVMSKKQNRLEQKQMPACR